MTAPRVNASCGGTDRCSRFLLHLLEKGGGGAEGPIVAAAGSLVIASFGRRKDGMFRGRVHASALSMATKNGIELP
jgi:hypothetical protein